MLKYIFATKSSIWMNDQDAKAYRLTNSVTFFYKAFINKNFLNFLCKFLTVVGGGGRAPHAVPDCFVQVLSHWEIFSIPEGKLIVCGS
jgi:hypothetical protein